MKSNFATGNRLQVIGNRLPESKNFGNLEKFEKKTLLKNKTALCLFFEKSFQYFPCEVFLISSLESWIHLLLNLEIKLLLNLESSWFLLMKLEINLDLELVDSILKSFSWAFCHHQNYLNQLDSSSWSLLLHRQVPSCPRDGKSQELEKTQRLASWIASLYRLLPGIV